MSMAFSQSRKRPYSLMVDIQQQLPKNTKISTHDLAADILAEMKGDVEVWKDFQDRLKSSSSPSPIQLENLLQKQLEHTKDSIHRVEQLVKTCRERYDAITKNNNQLSRVSAPVFGCPTIEDDSTVCRYSTYRRRSSESIPTAKRSKREGSLLSNLNPLQLFTKFLKSNHTSEESVNESSGQDIDQPLQPELTCSSNPTSSTTHEDHPIQTKRRELIYIALDDDDDDDDTTQHPTT